METFMDLLLIASRNFDSNIPLEIYFGGIWNAVLTTHVPTTPVTVLDNLAYADDKCIGPVIQAQHILYETFQSDSTICTRVNNFVDYVFKASEGEYLGMVNDDMMAQYDADLLGYELTDALNSLTLNPSSSPPPTPMIISPDDSSMIINPPFYAMNISSCLSEAPAFMWYS